MAIAGIAGVAVAVEVASSAIVVGAAKNVVIVKVENASMALPLIRRAPRAEDVARITERPGATVDFATNGRAAVARGATALIAPLLRSRETRADSVGIVYPEKTFVGDATFAGKYPFRTSSRSR